METGLEKNEKSLYNNFIEINVFIELSGLIATIGSKYATTNASCEDGLKDTIEDGIRRRQKCFDQASSESRAHLNILKGLSCCMLQQLCIFGQFR